MFVAVGSKYDISSYNNMTVKPAVWNAFSMSLESVLLWYFLFKYAFEHTSAFNFFLVFSFSVYLFYCIFYCVLLPYGVIKDDSWECRVHSGLGRPQVSDEAEGFEGLVSIATMPLPILSLSPIYSKHKLRVRFYKYVNYSNSVLFSTQLYSCYYRHSYFTKAL